MDIVPNRRGRLLANGMLGNPTPKCSKRPTNDPILIDFACREKRHYRQKAAAGGRVARNPPPPGLCGRNHAD